VPTSIHRLDRKQLRLNEAGIPAIVHFGFSPVEIPMLKPNKTRKVPASTGRFAIVASEYNRHYVDAMVRAARKELAKAGAASIRVVRVPGAFEIPVVAARLVAAANSGLSAIICLGVIFRGETVHAQQIGDSVSAALAELQVRHHVPIIHGVYLFENEEQAQIRCLGKKHGRGIETAQTALAMARLMVSLPGSGRKRSGL